jgi:hypothetical protein
MSFIDLLGGVAVRWVLDSVARVLPQLPQLRYFVPTCDISNGVRYTVRRALFQRIGG